MDKVRDLVIELRRKISQVAALTCAVSTMATVLNDHEQLQSLAQVSREHADESLAAVDRCISQLSRLS